MLTYCQNSFVIDSKFALASLKIPPHAERVVTAEMEPGHGSSGHRVTVYARVGSGLGSKSICVFRPDAVTRFLVAQQIDSFFGS